MAAGFHHATSEYESVVGIQFGIFSPEEIVKRSAVEVTSAATYDGNEPKIGGLFDPRMGVLDNGKSCRSCGQTNHNCPGHFGHYRLARPVYFIQFFEQIKRVLRCVCIRCGKLMIDKTQHAHLAKRRGEARWAAVKEACDKVKRCGQDTEDGCGTLKPSKLIDEGILRLVAEWEDLSTDLEEAEEAEDPLAKKASKGAKPVKKTVKQPLEVEYVLHLFRQITDEDVDFMGLSRYWCRPDWMICTVLPIPPPQVRPSVVQDNNQRSEDDITHKLFEIIKANKKLQEQIAKNANKHMIDELTTLLQYHVATLVDNRIPGVAPSAQRGGRPLKSIQQRIGSKEGRVRYNIQGKRVEQSARSVITGDPNISIAEVGVPKKIAMNLTRPEKVTKFNRMRLYKYVQNGADVYPGAKSIIRGKDGHMISLKHVNTKEIKLHEGDTVNRHLIDGDIILFNRQPTLHRLSMMGHRVRVLDYNTFRLNVQVVRPYNADFDGDEMNAHIPQSYEATAELEELAAVPMQMIRPRDSTPVIAIVQDALAGSYLATQPGNEFTRREFMNMMMKNKLFKGVPKPRIGAGTQARFTGQQLIGTLLSPININMPNSSFDEKNPMDKDRVIIQEGNFEQGAVDKKIYNTSGKGIVHTTYNDYGPQATVNLLDGVQNMMESYLIHKGFSVGVSDLIADEKTKDEMETIIKEKKKELDELLLQVHMNLFTNNSGKSNQEEFEDRAITILNKATGDAGGVGVKSLSDTNRLMAMVRSGSKGDKVNVSQMISCVGQQAPEGRRIPYGFTDRTLPHYKMYDDGAEARGFVEGSFLKGLNPQEFFFHAMSGREGLIDTAVKTADTGYTQRQLIKAMEDLMVQHDGTVRDATGKIVQFRYGEDGLNSTRLEETPLPIDKLSDKDIKDTYGLKNKEAELGQAIPGYVMSEDEKGALSEYVKELFEDRKMYVEQVSSSGMSRKVSTAVNLDRALLNIKTKFGLLNPVTKPKMTELTPGMVLEGIQKVAERTQPFNKASDDDLVNSDVQNRIWTATLRFSLAPHKMILQDMFSKEAFEALCEILVVKNWKAWATPGELVGIVAAQSIGEPATQMTLNTFHQAGVAAKSAMTRGVPRLKELLRLTKNPKASSLTIFLKDPFRKNKDLVRQVAQDLELTLLKDIVYKSAIYYDPSDETTVIEEDKHLINFFKRTEELGRTGICFEDESEPMEAEEQSKLSKWILRLEFDRETMFNKNISMDDVFFIVSSSYAARTIYTDYNSHKLVMRIRPELDINVSDQLASLKKFQSILLNNKIVRGVPSLRAVNLRKDKNRRELVDGKYETVEQYLLDTDGSNFLSVVTHPAVDGTKLFSTNVHEIYTYLGVEAARTALYSEISTLFEEGDINYRHLGLLCDVMCHGGRLMSVDRYGINKVDSGPLAKACFEETEKVLLKAALYGEMDPVTGVSANIMTGQPIRAGTAYTQILLDEVALTSMMQQLPDVDEEESDEEDLPDPDDILEAFATRDADPCSQINTRMHMVLPPSTTEGVEEEEDEMVLVTLDGKSKTT